MREKKEMPIYIGAEFGKMPPQDIPAEEELIACFLNGVHTSEVSFLREDSFYKDSNRLIFNAILELERYGSEVDLLTVTDRLRKSEKLDLVGGVYAISQLASKGTTNHIALARITEQHAIKRRVITEASALIREAFDDSTDAFELAEKAQDTFSDITFDEVNLSEVMPLERMKATKEYIENAIAKKGMTGLPTGLKTLDMFFGGWQESNVIVIGGKPGTFKTALVLFFAHNCNEPCYLIEQEMTSTQTGMRELGMATGIDTKKFRLGQLSNEDLQKINIGAGKISESKVFIEHENQTSITIIHRIKWAKKKLGIKMAIIDYFQLTDIKQNKGELQEAAYGNFMRDIKRLAKQLNIPIIVLSQFTKDSNPMRSKSITKPHNGLFKGSGAIEANADITILLWNICKEMHELGYSQEDIDNKQIDGTTEYAKNTLSLCVTKHRMGDLKDLFVGVVKSTNTFTDLDWVVRNLQIDDQLNDVYTSSPLPTSTAFNVNKHIEPIADDEAF